jgi:hypothetical protein
MYAKFLSNFTTNTLCVSPTLATVSPSLRSLKDAVPNFCFLTGTPPLTGSGTVHVVVQDVNDHSPVFEMQAYSASVRENMPPGTPVLQPTAVDKDADLNAKIR